MWPARRRERQPLQSASKVRGKTTPSASVNAKRCIHTAADALAPVRPGTSRKAWKAATSGIARPETAIAGASKALNAACAVAAERKVLSQAAR